jgi:hypothetical protein
MGVVLFANVVLVFSLLVPKSPCSHFSSKLPEWQLASGRFYIINLFGFVVGSLLKTVCTQAVCVFAIPNKCKHHLHHHHHQQVPKFPVEFCAC